MGLLDFDERWTDEHKQKEDAQLYNAFVPDLGPTKRKKFDELVKGRGYSVRRALEYLDVLPRTAVHGANFR